ncbi:cupin-like domain-containing protein [Archangium violaceum]|uniref:JmjC domain-containing protein n=1 Tax=Archangium violaceum Cb vi76 TaxID=1406225 RepID=A0A084SJJ0_9BACT|nr:cupin-like domain-containing protein [Archangium violaceum]KFA88625.1 hypothetical protein Q664_40080 [Archangium violaceum Cb vi76]
MIRTTPLPRVHAPSREEFIREYLEPRRPVIISGWMSEWPAMSKWSLGYFREAFGTREVNTMVDLPSEGTFFSRKLQPHARRQSLAAFVDLIESRERTRPCYLNAVRVESMEGLASDVPFPRFGPEQGSTKSLLWLGSEGTRLTFHFDFMDNFLAQVMGEKRLLLASPEDSASMYPSFDNLSESMVDVEAPDPSAWPRFAHARVLEGILRPGDMIFMPRVWWHEVRSLSPSISVNYWWSPTQPSDYLPVLRACTPRHYAHIAWQFLMHGALGLKPAERLYSPRTTGRLLWEEAVRQFRGAS